MYHVQNSYGEMEFWFASIKVITIVSGIDFAFIIRSF